MEEMNELTAEERARILQHELEAVYGRRTRSAAL